MTNPFYKVSTWDLWPRYAREIDAAVKGNHKAYWTAFDELMTLAAANVVDVIDRENDLDTMGEQALFVRAWMMNVIMPNVDAPLLRQYLTVAPGLLPYRGDYRVMEDAVFAFTGLSVTVSAPWQDPNLWTFGDGVFGDVEFGPDFRDRPSDAWVFGEDFRPFGDGVFGDDGENLHIPFILWIDLQFDPGVDQIERIRAIAEFFKRAIDICVIRIPEVNACWTIGETVSTSPELVERILLPNGIDTLTDAAMSVGSVSEDGSRVGIDTIVCEPYFVFEETPFGGGMIGEEFLPPERIILPDGSTEPDE